MANKFVRVVAYHRCGADDNEYSDIRNTSGHAIYINSKMICGYKPVMRDPENYVEIFLNTHVESLQFLIIDISSFWDLKKNNKNFFLSN